MMENKGNLSEVEKKIIISIIQNDELKYAILRELYEVNDFIKTSEIYERVERKLSDNVKGKSQSYYLKTLRNLEKSGLVVGIRPNIDRKNVYWCITDLGREIFEKLKNNQEDETLTT